MVQLRDFGSFAFDSMDDRIWFSAGEYNLTWTSERQLDFCMLRQCPSWRRNYCMAVMYRRAMMVVKRKQELHLVHGRVRLIFAALRLGLSINLLDTAD